MVKDIIKSFSEHNMTMMVHPPDIMIESDKSYKINVSEFDAEMPFFRIYDTFATDYYSTNNFLSLNYNTNYI